MRADATFVRVVLFCSMLLAVSLARADDPQKTIDGTYEVQADAKYNLNDFSSPLLDFKEIKLPSHVVITDDGSNTVRVEFVSRDGTPVEKAIDLAQVRLVRKDGAIEYEIEMANVGAKILPGKTVQTRRLVFSKDEHGDLRIVRNMGEKGLMLFLIPFSENRESVLTLRRAAKAP